MTSDAGDRFVREVPRLADMLGDFLRESGSAPMPDSIADLEVRGFTNPGLIRTAYSQATSLLNSAGDHMDAFVKVISPPANGMAAWTLVRGAVEAAATSAWLYDPTIDATERVKRSYAYRYEGIQEERKFLNTIGKVEEAEKSLLRLDFLENEATSLGYERVLNKKGQRVGIGKPMPSSTDIIEEMFGEQTQYRILSAMAHSLPYATSRLAHRMMSPEVEATVRKTEYHTDVAFLEPHLSVESIGLLSYWLMFAVASAAWFYGRLFGFDESGMATIFDETIGKFAKPDRCFWRPVS